MSNGFLISTSNRIKSTPFSSRNELAGVKNISAKQLGSDNLLNNAHATITALKNLKTPAIASTERNLPLERFYS